MTNLRLARRNYLNSTFGALLISGCREGNVIVNKILVDILMELPVLGSPKLKEVFLQNVYLYAVMECKCWRENYSSDFHQTEQLGQYINAREVLLKNLKMSSS